MSQWQVVAMSFVELADTIADDFDSLDFMQNLVDRAKEITGASAAGLILSDRRGIMRLAASTDHQSRVLELFAVSNSEGPCIDAFDSGKAVVNVTPEEARRRWPHFVSTALTAGYSSAHVVPMSIRSQVLGALSIFYRDEHVLTDDDQAILQALASVATIGLLQEPTPRQREVLAEQLQSTLDLQVTVEQAKGVVAESLGLDVDAAFHRLRAYGLRSGLPLSSVAAGVLAGSITPTSLNVEAPGPV
jgi:transcriptional regulator with GAF, ATPase, and Fis domain